MTKTNQTRRAVMLTAWGFCHGEPARTFADCLRGAWKLTKRLAKATAALMHRASRSVGPVSLSPSLIRSPIACVFNGRPGGAHRDFQAALVTARIGL